MIQYKPFELGCCIESDSRKTPVKSFGCPGAESDMCSAKQTSLLAQLIALPIPSDKSLRLWHYKAG
jgi:hypothetical protein